MGLSLDTFTNKLSAAFGGKKPPRPKIETNLSLSKLKSQVTDYARPNRFKANIFPPEFIKAVVDQDLEFIQWNVQAAKIPSRGQGDVGIKYHGMELKLVGDYVKENLSITFLNDYGFVGRDLFEIWLEAGSQKTYSTHEEKLKNSKTHSKNMFDSTIVIHQIGRKDKPIKSYRFYNVMPLNVAAIELDMSNTDQVEKFTVEFSYSHYEIDEIPDEPKEIDQNPTL